LGVTAALDAVWNNTLICPCFSLPTFLSEIYWLISVNLLRISEHKGRILWRTTNEIFVLPLLHVSALRMASS
jgi:hypothetical protein